MEKVNFLIAGTQKGGTASMHKYLKQHPQICVSDTKEIHFFDKDNFFTEKSDIEQSYTFYHTHFSPKSHHKVFGEATPKYMYDEEAIQRIYQYNPNMKFILLLRNPIDRAYSHWNMGRDMGREKEDFTTVIKKEILEINSNIPKKNRKYSYIDRGFYAKQIKSILSYFPKDNVCIINSSDLQSNPLNTLNTIYSFLNITDKQNINKKALNKREYMSPISIEDKIFLKNIFKADIKELEILLKKDYSEWID